jgi:hypothetical protein
MKRRKKARKTRSSKLRQSVVKLCHFAAYGLVRSLASEVFSGVLVPTLIATMIMGLLLIAEHTF